MYNVLEENIMHNVNLNGEFSKYCVLGERGNCYSN